MKKRSTLLYLCPLVSVLCFLTSCQGSREQSPRPGIDRLTLTGAVSESDPTSALQPTVGRRVYVSSYSVVHVEPGKEPVPLSITLSIRNTDLATPIYITKLKFVDTEGTIVRSLPDEQVFKIAALGTAETLVRERDLVGGSGANFLVEWVAESSVSPPQIEALMIGRERNQGISFLAEGTTIGIYRDGAIVPTTVPEDRNDRNGP